MKNKKDILQLPLRFEFAYEIIYKSTCVILFGLTFLFGSNLLRFNVYSVIFGLLTITLIYLRRSSYLIIENNRLKLIYFKFIQGNEVNLDTIKECCFYEESSLIEIKTEKNHLIKFYLKDKNKEKLMNWIVTHHPSISTLYVNNNEKNS